jgi:hypothetical protein
MDAPNRGLCRLSLGASPFDGPVYLQEPLLHVSAPPSKSTDMATSDFKTHELTSRTGRMPVSSYRIAFARISLMHFNKVINHITGCFIGLTHILEHLGAHVTMLEAYLAPIHFFWPPVPISQRCLCRVLSCATLICR